MIRSLAKKIIFLIILAAIGYAIYWLIDKKGAEEFKNTTITVIQETFSGKLLSGSLLSGIQTASDSGSLFPGISMTGNTTETISATASSLPPVLLPSKETSKKTEKTEKLPAKSSSQGGSSVLNALFN